MDGFQSDPFTISCLFPEILTIIFRNLDIRDKGHAAQVCTKWRDAAYNRSVWRGVEAKLHLKKCSQTLFSTLLKRGITKVQVLSVRRNLRDVIVGISNLDKLNLSGCYNVTDSILISALSTHLPALTVLNLSLCKKITNTSIETISKHMPNLQFLDVAGCSNLTTDGLTCIAWGLCRLKHLNLRSCRQVSDRAVGYICGQNVNVTGAKGNLQLETLSLQDCQKLSDQALKYLAEGLTCLRVLNLSFCASITDVGVRFLAKIPTLRDLNLSSCDNISDIGVGYLSEGVARIEKLDVSFCERVGDIALIHMSQGMYHLHQLSMRNCDITDGGLSKLVRSAPDIAVLNIGQCSKITDHSLRLIAKYLKRLQSIDLYGCNKITTAGLEGVSLLPRFHTLNLALWQKTA